MNIYISSNPSFIQLYLMQSIYFILYPYPYQFPSSSFYYPSTLPNPSSFNHPFSQQQIKLQCSLQQTNELINHQETDTHGDLKRKQRKISRFKYAKKNVESNVINQCLSYLTTKAKSYPMIVKILQSEEKIKLFYEIVKQGRKKLTKYMGRSVLQNLLQLKDSHPVAVAYKKKQGKASLKMHELKRTMRVMVNYFLKSVIITTILTSTKLDRSTIREHMKRVREIYSYISYVSSTSY